MKFASDQLLPGAALTHDEYRTGHRRDADDRFLELRERGARADERGFQPEPVPQQRDLGGQAPPFDRVLDLLRDALHRLRLVDEAVRTEADCLSAAVVVARAGVDDDGHAQSQALDRAQHLEPVHPRHFEIENDAVHRIARQALERRAAALRDECFVAAEPLEVIGVLLGHGRNVIDDQDQCHESIGISTMNVDPCPASVSTLSEPFESRTSRRTIDSPSPVPPGLVVWKSSNALSSSDLLMPRPVSLTEMRTIFLPRSVVTVTLPFFPSRLSTALLTRFSITRRNTSASAETGGSPSASLVRTVPEAPIVSRTTLFTSVAFRSDCGESFA